MVLSSCQVRQFGYHIIELVARLINTEECLHFSGGGSGIVFCQQDRKWMRRKRRRKRRQKRRRMRGRELYAS